MRIAGPAPFGLTRSRLTRYVLPAVVLALAAYTLCGVWLDVRVARELARLGLDEAATESPELAAARVELVEAMAWLAEIPWREDRPFGVPYMLTSEHAADIEVGVADRSRFYAAIDSLPNALWSADGAPLHRPGTEHAPIVYAPAATYALCARAWTRARLHGDVDGAGHDLARGLVLLRVIDNRSLTSTIMRRGLETTVLLAAERILDGADFAPAPMLAVLGREVEFSLRENRSTLVPKVELQLALQHHSFEDLDSWFDLWVARPFLGSHDLELIGLYECFQTGESPPSSISVHAEQVWTIWTKYPQQERTSRAHLAEQWASLRS